MTGRPALPLRLAGGLAVAVVGSAVGLRFTELPGIEDPAPGRFVAVLVGLALLCLAGLASRVEPVAMVLLVAAGGAAAIDGIALGHAVDAADPGRQAWPLVAAVVGFEATATAAIAAIYVSRRNRHPVSRTVAVLAVGWLGVSSVIVIAAVLNGVGEDPALTWLDIATYPQRAWPQIVTGMLAVGVTVDLLPAVARARRTLDAADAAAGRPRSRRSPRQLIGAILDEIEPGRRRAAVEAAAAERHRLASDLHASVLPALRAAIAEADELRSLELLGRRLREVLDEIETTLLDRRFVVLEELGLVEAVEWLAERIEERAGLTVDLVIGEDRQKGRPPAVVEEAAFRVARLALDNVVRHSEARRITITVDASERVAKLTITDDGRGWDPALAASAVRVGRLGVVDMRSIASAVGARCEITHAGATGTRVQFAWQES